MERWRRESVRRTTNKRNKATRGEVRKKERSLTNQDPKQAKRDGRGNRRRRLTIQINKERKSEKK